MPSQRSTKTQPVETGPLLDLGRRSGLAAVGVTSAELLQPALPVIELRKEAGLAGDMQFTYRNPARSCDPSRLLPGARSIIAGAWAYGHWRDPAATADPAGHSPTAWADQAAGSDGESAQGSTTDGSGRAVGRVARYSWHDHYDDLRRAMQPMADELVGRGYRAVVVADTNALVDRNVAWSAGLGWYGKNSNLLLPGTGSWYVLGAVVTDAELQPTGPPIDDGCGSCSQCIDDCPTAAIVAPGMVDATRCLAWLVQAGGSIPIEFREAVGDRLYGCDDCQDVCPPNKSADRTGSHRTGQSAESDQVAEADQVGVELHWILTAADDEIEARHGRWYIADRNIDVIRRTALVVLGNVATPTTPQVAELLTRYLASDVAVLRNHAAWAARRLGRPDLVADPTAGVIDEDELAAEVTPRFTPQDWSLS